MAWGDPNTTIKRLLSNGVSTWGAAGNPNVVQIQRSGILRKLTLLQTGTVTVTLASAGSVAQDALGPWNLYTWLSLLPNDGAPIINISGYSAYLVMLAKSLEDMGNTPDTVVVSEASANALADVYKVPTSGTAQDFRFYEELYLTQYIKDVGELGYWPLDNPQVQVTLNYSPVNSDASSPYNIKSTTASNAPYLTDANSTVVLNNPTIDVRRELFQVPVNEGDEPDLNFVVQTTESQPQGNNANSATTAEWKATNNSGILLRLIAYVQDAGAGVAESKMTLSNSLNLKYGADENKTNETGRAAKARMSRFYGFLPPAGVFIYDFLGKDLTLQDSVNLTTMPEFRLDFNFTTALGSSNSVIKVVQQRLVPISRRSAK